MASKQETAKPKLRGLARLMADLNSAPTGTHPLTSSQVVAWNHYAGAKSAAAWHLGCRLEIRGALNVAVLKQSLEEIQRRHEPLRMAIDWFEGAPEAVVQTDVALPWSEAGASALEESLKLLFEEQSIEKDFRWRFDLSVAPLWRARLIERSSECHILALVFHCSIADVQSLELFLAELGEHYNALSIGSKSWLPENQDTYGKIVTEQAASLAPLDEHPDWTFYQQSFHALPIPPSLPFGSPPLEPGAAGSGFEHVAFPDGLRTQILELSQGWGVSPASVFYSIFGLLLGRHLETFDFLIATDSTGRHSHSEQGIIGAFANPLPLRVQWKLDQSLAELAKSMSAMSAQAFCHSSLPFEVLFPSDRAQAGSGYRNPPRVLVNYLGRGLLPPELDGLDVTVKGFRQGPGRFELRLDFHQSREALHAFVAYRSEWIPKQWVHRLLADFEFLVQQATASPNVRISTLIDALPGPSHSGSDALPKVA